MELLESELDKVADDIKQLESKRKVFGTSISGIKSNLVFASKDQDILENKFVVRVEPDKLDKTKVIGIDGGIVSSQYHGMDLVLGRAAAVVFDYQKGKLMNSEYYPEPFPTPKPLAFTKPSTSQEFALNTSIERLKMEISLAKRAVEEFSPQLLLLDGSILPHGADKPRKDSFARNGYDQLVLAYTSLYEICKKKNTLLAGVVEDSSGLRLAKLLEAKIVPGILKSGEFKRETIDALSSTKDILATTKDSNLLYYILDVGERSCVFSYSRDPKNHQILQDLERWHTQVNSFYLKSVMFDRPVRIDFIGDKMEQANKIASMVYAMSMHNETYGCPSILIEADARAKLSENDLELVYHKLKDKVGDIPSLFKLRRELRPF